MRKKGWRRIEYKGPDRRQHASAFDAARGYHDATADEWTRARVAQHEDHGQKPLYHYTGAGGLGGILASGRFWATHIRDFEDEHELRYAFAIASELLDAAKDRTSSRNGRAVLSAAKTALNIFEDHFDVYVVSLCERCDLDDMWKDYADQDQGFALEIVPDGDPEQAPVREGKPLTVFRKVIYDEELQRDLFNNTIQRVLRDVEALERAYGEFGLRHAGKPFARLLFYFLLDYSAAFKRHDPYSREHEWRYLALFAHGSDEARKAKSRKRGDKEIRYMELDLWSQKHGDLKLSRILSGLACSPDAVSEAVRQLAKAKHEAVAVESRAKG